MTQSLRHIVFRETRGIRLTTPYDNLRRGYELSDFYQGGEFYLPESFGNDRGLGIGLISSIIYEDRKVAY